MRVLKQWEPVVLRFRYLILLAWSAAWFIPSYRHYMNAPTDWNVIEYAARSVIHLNSHYPDGFHLYAREPEIQVGPPPIFALAIFQGLSPNRVALGFAIFMVLAGIGTVGMVEALSTRIAATRVAGSAAAATLRRQRTALIGGMALMVVWSASLARYRHLDDVLAISLTVAAMLVIQRKPRSAWWLAALLIGIAVASKPWALGAAPVLAMLPRERRPHAVLLALGVVAGCYAPFVLVDHSTVSALSNYRLYVDPRSTLHLLGVHSQLAPNWVRNAQIGLALVVSFVLVSRGRWLYVPLAAFAIRVALDPQTWTYYGLGPIVGALLLDFDQDSRLPWWTMATAAVEGLVPVEWPGAGGWVRLVWFVVVVIRLLTLGRPTPTVAPGDTPAPADIERSAMTAAPVT